MTMAKKKHDEHKQDNEKVARQRVTTHGYYYNGAVIPAGSNPDDYPGVIPEEFIQEVDE